MKKLTIFLVGLFAGFSGGAYGQLPSNYWDLLAFSEDSCLYLVDNLDQESVPRQCQVVLQRFNAITATSSFSDNDLRISVLRTKPLLMSIADQETWVFFKQGIGQHLIDISRHDLVDKALPDLDDKLISSSRFRYIYGFHKSSLQVLVGGTENAGAQKPVTDENFEMLLEKETNPTLLNILMGTAHNYALHFMTNESFERGMRFMDFCLLVGAKITPYAASYCYRDFLEIRSIPAGIKKKIAGRYKNHACKLEQVQVCNF